MQKRETDGYFEKMDSKASLRQRNTSTSNLKPLAVGCWHPEPSAWISFKMTYSQTPKTQKPTWFRWDLCVLWGISMQKLPLKNTLFCPFCKEMQRFCKGKKIWYHIVNQLDARKLCIFAFLHSCICTVFVMEAMSSPCKNIPADCFYNWWLSLCIIAEWKGESALAPYPFSAAFCRVFSLALAK